MDFSALRQDYPGWRFGTIYSTDPNRPVIRHLIAVRGAVLLAHPTEEGLRRKLEHEQASDNLYRLAGDMKAAMERRPIKPE